MRGGWPHGYIHLSSIVKKNSEANMNATIGMYRDLLKHSCYQSEEVPSAFNQANSAKKS